MGEGLVRRDNRLVHEVTERIRSMILSGELEAGSRLHQERLAELLNVSRTPVREALLQLEQDGLILVTPGRGRFVRVVTDEEMRAVHELRLFLEPLAARLSCERAGSGAVSRLRAVQAKQRRRLDRGDKELFGATVEFHRELVSSCGNGLLVEFLNRLWGHEENQRLFDVVTGEPGRLAAIVADHDVLLDAFAAGDGARVEELMRDHIQSELPTPAGDG